MATAAKPLLAALHLDLKAVETGVPLTTLADFTTRSGIPLKGIYDVVIPARTLKHRRARRQSLTPDESDKLARLARTFDHATRVFASPDRSREWLETPKRRFESRTPLDMLRTEAGARLVEELLTQIDYGMFA